MLKDITNPESTEHTFCILFCAPLSTLVSGTNFELVSTFVFVTKYPAKTTQGANRLFWLTVYKYGSSWWEKACGQVCEIDDHVASSVRMRREKEREGWYSPCFCLCFCSGTPTHGVIPPVRWVFLPQFIDSGNSNRHAQRLVSLMILDPL